MLVPPDAAALSHGCWFRLLPIGERDQSGLAALLEPVTLPADVDGGGVVQQPVEDGGGDDRVTEDGTPLPIALVRRQDDRAGFVNLTWPLLML